MTGIELPPGFEMTDELREKLGQMADKNPPAEDELEGNEPTGKPVTTAFLVLINPDNSVQISPDANIDIVLDRYPTPFDFKHGCREILSQIEHADTAGVVAPATVQILLGTMEQLQQRQGAASLAQATQQGFDPRLLKGGL